MSREHIYSARTAQAAAREALKSIPPVQRIELLAELILEAVPEGIERTRVGSAIPSAGEGDPNWRFDPNRPGHLVPKQIAEEELKAAAAFVLQGSRYGSFGPPTVDDRPPELFLGLDHGTAPISFVSPPCVGFSTPKPKPDPDFVETADLPKVPPHFVVTVPARYGLPDEAHESLHCGLCGGPIYPDQPRVIGYKPNVDRNGEACATITQFAHQGCAETGLPPFDPTGR